jgi:hypothetical protein
MTTSADGSASAHVMAAKNPAAPPPAMTIRLRLFMAQNIFSTANERELTRIAKTLNSDQPRWLTTPSAYSRQFAFIRG